MTHPEQRRPLFAAYSDTLAGWCVFRSVQGSASADVVHGPFQQREQAEALLGPAMPSRIPAQPAPDGA